MSPNLFFEKLTFEDSNGKECIPCPSASLSSCAYDCAFCPTSKSTNGMVTAKSYTPDQPSFKRLIENDNDFVRCILQYMLYRHVIGCNVSKLAMRHLGGTFHSYDTLYIHTYSRDIFYAANILSDIIDNHMDEAKKYLQNKFDPNNMIMSKVRKPFNSDKINLIQQKINDNKMWGDKFISNIKMLEKDLLQEIDISLLTEQQYNVNAKCKIVSYSIETRPDQINIKTMEELLKLGVTIVELGLQSPNDDVLRLVKRGHLVKHSKWAIRMLKDNGFHVHGQWMMDLPSVTKEIEMECVEAILQDDLQCDQIKIYPHLMMPGTITSEWITQGLYDSWVEKDWEGFLQVLSNFISRLDKTTRIVRIQRDLPQVSDKNPNGYINNQPSNLEQIITNKIYKDGMTREDIRFHEPGLRFPDLDTIQYNINIKERFGGKDVFISAESYVCADQKKGIKDFRVVWGYCRLSLPDSIINQISIFTENPNMKFGLIREVKVNGSITSVGNNSKSVQHLGIGTRMIQMAEEIAMQNGKTHITVTSAVGVRNYYKNKHNYTLHRSGLMWKQLRVPGHVLQSFYFDIVLFIISITFIIYHLLRYFF
jgi:elongator complex protein 3